MPALRPAISKSHGWNVFQCVTYACLNIYDIITVTNEPQLAILKCECNLIFVCEDWPFSCAICTQLSRNNPQRSSQANSSQWLSYALTQSRQKVWALNVMSIGAAGENKKADTSLKLHSPRVWAINKINGLILLAQSHYTTSFIQHSSVAESHIRVDQTAWKTWIHLEISWALSSYTSHSNINVRTHHTVSLYHKKMLEICIKMVNG